MNIVRRLLRPGLWKHAVRLLLKGYEENEAAIRKLGSRHDAIIEATVSLKQPERIFLGRNVHIGHLCVIWPGSGTVTIKDNVLLGPNVQIFASNHGIRGDTIMESQKHIPKSVTIEPDCWLGAGVIVLPGVRLAEGTVVAAGAVVTKNTEPYSIVAGVPARMIDKRPNSPDTAE